MSDRVATEVDYEDPDWLEPLVAYTEKTHKEAGLGNPLEIGGHTTLVIDLVRNADGTVGYDIKFYATEEQDPEGSPENRV